VLWKFYYTKTTVSGKAISQRPPSKKHTKCQDPKKRIMDLTDQTLTNVIKVGAAEETIFQSIIISPPPPRQ
jgi:hypothetical protein